MVQILEAVFDGTVLRPDEPIELEPNTRVRLVLETMPSETPQPTSFLRTARALQLDGPPDWSVHLDTL